MSKSQLASEFEWVAGGGNDLQLLQPGSLETTHFEFLREGYLYMTEEESDHLPHGVYSTSLSPSPTASSPIVQGGAHAVLVRRTSDPTIKVCITTMSSIEIQACCIAYFTQYFWPTALLYIVN